MNLTLFSVYVVSNLMPYLNKKVGYFRGGQLSNFLPEWRSLTSDPQILNTVTGEIIDFVSVPVQSSYPPNSICKDHIDLAEREIASLADKGVILPCDHEPGEFISPIFTVPKSDGKVRLILNLKRLNTFIETVHFKMESIHSILNLVTQNCWMASLDLKEAYYSVRIHPESQKFLKFVYKGILYKYTVYPNGLCICPRNFTKLMKPPLSHLRLKGHIIAGYIDDLYLQGQTLDECTINVIDSIQMFESLGLVIHPDKSVIIPRQKIVFLGFQIDSVAMTVTLTEDKKTSIKLMLQELIKTTRVKIRAVAKAIGHMISSLPGVKFGVLYYRNLEIDKIEALKHSKGNFESLMIISRQGITEIEWWINNIDTSFNNICAPPIDMTIYSDASLQGWGAVLDDTKTGGRWSPSESGQHINYLELLAAYLALKCFHTLLRGKHVKIMIDNTTAVALINNMGTCHNKDCNTLVVQIWEFCMLHKITWITAAHIPGVLNELADRESRNFTSQDTEWRLNPDLLKDALSSLHFEPEIDLFASRLNKQFEVYCSYKPDPGASFINAFTISWSNRKFYSFPPFSCISKVIQKIIQDKATGVIVVPLWPSQAWYPLLFPLLVLPPVELSPSKNLLTLPASPETVHPLHKKLRLLICLLSGNV